MLCGLRWECLCAVMFCVMIILHPVVKREDRLILAIQFVKKNRYKTDSVILLRDDVS